MPHGGVRPMAKQLVQDRLDECRRTLKIFRREGMIDGFGHEPAVFEPCTRPLMEEEWQVRVCLVEAEP